MTTRTSARFETPNGSRYLQQLCKHWQHKLALEFTSEHARIQMLNSAVTTLDADEGGLTMAIEAADDHDLGEAREVVVRHIERFAFREAPLSLTWS